MRPDKLTIHDLFQRDRRYTVPLYQRSYVWNKGDQWAPLWEDIERQAEACLASPTGIPRHSHFLGAVVLNVQKIVGSSAARSEVIDGQQRLTTLQVFLAALRDFATVQGSQNAGRLQRLTINEYEKPGSESSFKIWPTNADRALFRSVMTAGSTSALLKDQGLESADVLPRLGACYAYFAKCIEEYAFGSGAESQQVERRIFGLFQALRTGLQLVVIELEDDDDPQVIFETLNARGQPLLPSDLIRNTVFHQASVDPAHIGEPHYADHLYHQYWQPFDTDRINTALAGENRYWHVPERQGRLTRPRIDLFIFHFLTMQTGAELNIGHLFQEFRDWRSQSDQSLETFLAELQRYAVIFRKLISPKGNERSAVLARRLRSLDTSTVYPFLLYTLGLPTSQLSIGDRNQILTDMESWLIRRFICQLTNKNYNKFFLALLNKVRQILAKVTTETLAVLSSTIADAVRQELQRSREDTGRWPDDEEFKQGWLENPVYYKSRPDRSVMVLSAIDAQMRSTKNEQIELPEDLTVEHLLPQQGNLNDYPMPNDFVIAGGEPLEGARTRLIHTVGNLTLLTQGLNSSVSNGPFHLKRPAIAEHSALRLNARFQDHAQIKWNEDDIRKRGEDLFHQALSIWPRAVQQPREESHADALSKSIL
jgi:hypothetical protein